MPAGNQAFLPQGGTIILALTSLGSAAVGISTAANLQGAMFDNLSTVNAVVAIGGSGVVATQGSTAAFTAGQFTLLGLNSKVLSIPPNSYVSACTTAASLVAQITVTPGYGVS
jgi:hypothetical protein